MGDSWRSPLQLAPSANTAHDYFGASVGISGDWAIVGASQLSTSYHGKVYFFKRSGNDWIQQQIVHGGANDQFFGSSVAISGDYALVGAPCAQGYNGKAYVLKRNGNYWSVVQALADLIPNSAPNDEFGHEVCLSGDNGMVSANASSTAYIFEKDAAGLFQLKKTCGISGYNSAIAINCNYAAHLSESYPYKIKVYKKSAGGSWDFDTYLSPSEGNSQNLFGTSVAICNNYLLAGCDGQSGGQYPGMAYLFTRTDEGFWYEKEKIRPINPVDYNHFGHSVALSDNIAVVGAFGWDNGEGAAYIFSDYSFPCERLIEECDIHPGPGSYDLRQGGSLKLGGPYCSAVFDAGVRVHYVGNEVKLEPGFHALPGSEFEASAMVCPSSLHPFACEQADDDAKGSGHAESMNGQELTGSPAGLLVSPNPAHEKFIVRVPRPTEFIRCVEVFHPLGGLVYRKETDGAGVYQVALPGRPSGMYLLSVQTTNATYRVKVLLE